jgi:hypothetical protein
MFCSATQGLAINEWLVGCSFLPAFFSLTDADDTTMAALLGEQARPAGVKSEEQDDAQGGNNNAAASEAVKQERGKEAAAADAMDVDAAAAGGDDQRTAAAAAGGEEQQGGLRASGSSAVLCKEPQADGQQAGAAPRRQSGAQDQAGAPGSAGAQKPPLHPAVAKLAKQDSMQPSSAGVSQSGAEGGATETEAGTTVDQAAQPLRPVSQAVCRRDCGLVLGVAPERHLACPLQPPAKPAHACI